MAWRLLGQPVFGHASTMKNFARLVRFAWPYRVRFGFSLACAIMVALLWGANISAVYPLLKILFYSENCQKWVAEKIVAIETDLRAVDARLEEIARIRRAPGPIDQALKQHFVAIHGDRQQK